MFGEHIYNLINRRNVVDCKIFLEDFIPDEMKIKFNMLGAGMEDRICIQMSSTLTITPCQRWSKLRDAEFLENRLDSDNLCYNRS